MNLQRIILRERCCELINRHQLRWGLTGLLDEETLINGCQRIAEEDIFSKMVTASAQTQKAILSNPSLSDYACNLLTQGISMSLLERLIEQIPAEELVTYSVSQVAKTAEALIPNKLNGIFLRYYADAALDEKQCRNLVSAMEIYMKKLETVDEKLLASHKMLFCSNALAGYLLRNLAEYGRCVNLMAENDEIFCVLEYISHVSGIWTELDDENFRQIEKDPKRIMELLKWVVGFYQNENEMQLFCTLWLENHALLYDLERMKKKAAERGMEKEAHQMLAGRMSYIAFFYNAQFTEKLPGKKEELMIYAITHRKKAFMDLVNNNMDDFKSIPESSFLFDRTFYTKVVNLNAMNLKNLKSCQEGKYSAEILGILSDKGCTFEEAAVLIDLPKEYAMLYMALKIPQVDQRLRVIRQVVKKRCLSPAMDVNRIADKLSIKPLCQWIEEDFSHIRDLDMNVCMMLLQEYDRISHLAGDITSISEARYVTSYAELLQNKKSMEEVREEALSSNPEWLSLRQTFHFTSDFVKQNKERIKQFIYDDGAYIMWNYRKEMTDRDEDLRRLISAELMGRFRELKYHRGDLNKEIDYEIPDNAKHFWTENLHMEEGRLQVWEEDGLIPIMKMGEVPEHTCLSYLNGRYKGCLLACHDSNKKALLLSYDGKVVLRAAIRLTKSCFAKIHTNGKSDARKLRFVDLEHPEENAAHNNNHMEHLTLFLEKAYMSNLPQNMQAHAVKMLFRLLRKKADQMNALFMASVGYQIYHPEDMVCVDCAVYISKSKAGEQYLDSLGGENCVDKEGSYRENIFLIEKDLMQLAG
jgi:hypothetical protein